MGKKLANNSFVWTPPSASLGSRTPSIRSAGSSRGVDIHHAANRRVLFESDKERKVFVVTLARQDVADVHDQPAPVDYIDKDGVARQHTFDFLVTKIDGEKVAVAVKSEEKEEKLRETLELIAQQIPTTFADSVTVMTELDVPWWLDANSILMLSVNCESALEFKFTQLMLARSDVAAPATSGDQS